MLGKNVIRMSKDEMKAAMSHYFKTVLFTEQALDGTAVTDVEPVKAEYGGGSDGFDITLERAITQEGGTK